MFSIVQLNNTNTYVQFEINTWTHLALLLYSYQLTVFYSL